jgi:hypothetical protein
MEFLSIERGVTVFVTRHINKDFNEIKLEDDYVRTIDAEP